MVPLPWVSIWIISYFIHNHTPLRLIPRTRSQVSSEHSCKGARGREPIPALLWAQSKRPYVSTVVLIMAATAVALDTSVLTKVASPPFSVIIWTVCCPPSSFISAMTSFAPSRANVRAVARPIPEAPPVTKATLPFDAMLVPPSCRVRPQAIAHDIRFAQRASALLGTGSVVPGPPERRGPESMNRDLSNMDSGLGATRSPGMTDEVQGFAAADQAAAAPALAAARGSVTVTLVPLPCALSIVIPPPCSSTIALLSGSPRPVPS